jgi:hypothetical protein
MPGVSVRLQDDLRKSVCFLGVQEGDPKDNKILCLGTAFLVFYKDIHYMVTAKHVAEGLGDDPFLVRLNKADGSSTNIGFDLTIDPFVWRTHPNQTVDLAAMAFPYGFHQAGFDCLYVPEWMFATRENTIGIETDQAMRGIDIGDFCYTIGLFRRVSGNKRNLPVVHFGTIAMIPSDEELIPVRGRPPQNELKLVEAYLVESQALEGLSGSPVFVRLPTALASQSYNNRQGDSFHPLAFRMDPLLLGVWQSSWDAPATDILTAGRGMRVPLGMGVVVPIQKLIELFETDDACAEREKIANNKKLHEASIEDGST